MSDDLPTGVSGVLTYRQRIALIPGGTANVVVVDVSHEDVAVSVLAETTIDLGAAQVPLRLEVDIDLQWATDTVRPIDRGHGLGALTLVRVQRAVPRIDAD